MVEFVQSKIASDLERHFRCCDMTDRQLRAYRSRLYGYVEHGVFPVGDFAAAQWMIVRIDSALDSGLYISESMARLQPFAFFGHEYDFCEMVDDTLSLAQELKARGEGDPRREGIKKVCKLAQGALKRMRNCKHWKEVVALQRVESHPLVNPLVI